MEVDQLFCRFCGSYDLEYVGIEDGGGDFGEMLCDEYQCVECRMTTSINCVEVPDDTKSDTH